MENTKIMMEFITKTEQIIFIALYEQLNWSNITFRHMKKKKKSMYRFLRFLFQSNYNKIKDIF